MTRYRGVFALSVVLVMLAAACGGGESQEEAPAGGEDGTATASTCDDVDLSAPPGEPVPIRMGNGIASEEPLWLVEAAPDVAANQGTWYELELEPFRANEDRLAAYQAGELDAASSPPQALIRAFSQDVPITAVAVMLREGEEDFNSTFIALEGSGIDAVEDLPGTTVALVDLGSHFDYLAKAAVAEAGADFASGAEYVVLPFPAQEEALRSGQIDVAGLPEPFYSAAMAGGGVVDVFDALDITGFPFDVLTIGFRPEFIDENLGPVCAFLADFSATTNYYRENRDEGRQLVHEAGFVQIPLDAYQRTQDYERPEDGAIDLDTMQQLMDSMIEFNVLQEDQRVDLQELVRPGVSLTVGS